MDRTSLTAAIVAAGELPEAGHDVVRPVLASADLVVAVDGGLDHCRTLEVQADVVVGDFDSVSEGAIAQAEGAGATIVCHPVAKDETDLELAIAVALARGATAIVAVAVFGGRLDHELGALAVLARSHLGHVDVSAVDGVRTVHIVHGGSTLDLNVEASTTVSLVPWAGDAEGVTTTGLAWTLDDELLASGQARGISNVAVDATQHISVGAGTVLVVVDRSETA